MWHSLGQAESSGYVWHEASWHEQVAGASIGEADS